MTQLFPWDPRPVLDHGFVRLRNASGPERREVESYDADDVDPAQAARISFDNLGDVRTREQDLKLCEYLLKNGHTTPWEMIELWFEMKMPIFVARQFVRHRTVTINEVSARYVQLPKEWYIPQYDTVGFKPHNAKQGREQVPWSERTDQERELITDFCDGLNKYCGQAYDQYEAYLLQGIAPELARSFLHLNHYTHWIWKQDLHNMMHFLGLRLHSHAQYEARQYAEAIYDILRQVLPNSMDLFDKYRRMAE